jgi:hypothetical protein
MVSSYSWVGEKYFDSLSLFLGNVKIAWLLVTLKRGPFYSPLSMVGSVYSAQVSIDGKQQELRNVHIPDVYEKLSTFLKGVDFPLDTALAFLTSPFSL